MSSPNVIVAGIRGRMGRQIAQLVLHSQQLTLGGGTVRADDDLAGSSISMTDADDRAQDVPVTATVAEFNGLPDAVIDFTCPDYTIALLDDCVPRKIAMVIGTTGFTPEQEDRIRQAAEKIAIVKAGNMSLGINLLTLLVEQAAAALGPGYDIEIHEAHHRHKKDAPSGTALMLGEAAARGRGVTLKDKAVYAREGQTGERPDGAIGFSVTRAGGIVGEHEVLLGSDEEVISLSHKALDRAVFARGAVTAAGWIAGREPGLYSMRDVLGL
ncbi:4-hydroxy-tetrahydrodipicolinate reductase [Aquisalinus flavus]|uniref:4-hydroxy-tetrahydrodipicolinate reductase n=1 Tax=Aquisalinus flavus TaxID=1526572 RepID=A0A8J2V3B2_9PROT|nr:4-hydroxy-tetrahydrodipicolinate reductase [Aquisalinus flavus]MBD0425699.1 4-hydroxy-tetrahydrodipicolinate reductase [Aquisalinus flavus]UNE48689.1 4-hydroxy-tetrahydrodipicolinate reductase [Aquisalinus flavus]GGD13996.1 4-hydroxy-tetrahydrodipicolinate reductase [Aquisalinus flavus]